MTIATRSEVGTCGLGNVFIFAQSSEDGRSWRVVAGNHVIGTYGTEAGAQAVANALCGIASPPSSPAPTPEPELVAARVSRK